MSVPASVTGLAMPATATTFPAAVPRPAPPQGSLNFPSPSTQSIRGTADNTATLSTFVTNTNAGKHYTASPVTLSGGTFSSGNYYFSGPVNVSGNVTIDGGVNIYVVNGDFTVRSGSTLTFAANNGGNNGATIYLGTGNFDASQGTVNFTGDTAGNSGYAIRGAETRFGVASFGGGRYAFEGGGVVLGSNNQTTSLGAADYYVATGGVTVAAGGAAAFATTVANSATSKTTTLKLGGGAFTGAGTVTFNSGNVAGVSYAFSGASSYAFNGSTTFGAASGDLKGYGLYDGAVTLAPSGGATASLDIVNFYVDTGNLSINGPTTFAATTSANPTTITLASGDFSNNATGNLTFTGGGTSQYNFCFGSISNAGACGSSNGHGISLSGPVTFNSATYFVLNGSSSALGLALNNGANASFASGIYSLQKGNVTINAGATAALTAGTFCTPSGGASAGSCFYLADGGTVNSGTMNLGAGNFYFQNGADTSSSSGFASGGTLNVAGGAGSNYHFYNGPAYGTDQQQACSGGGGGNATYGALSILEASTTNLGPANYYAVNGALCMNQTAGTAAALSCANCSVGGAGLTFILTGSSPANVSTLQVRGDIATSNFNAPNGTPDGAACAFSTPGCYKGVLFLQDPMRDGNGDPQTPVGTISGQSCANHSNCSWLEGGDNMALTGAVYVPQSIVSFKANYAYDTTGCLVIIAQGIIFTGNSTLTATGCTSAGVATLTSNSVTLTQ
jgi:hypothetical protein